MQLREQLDLGVGPVQGFHVERVRRRHASISGAKGVPRDWDRFLSLFMPDAQFIVSGSGDVIEPAVSISAIGSGGPFASSAALALKKHSDLNAEAIVKESMQIAGQVCIYTNQHLTIEKLENNA